MSTEDPHIRAAYSRAAMAYARARSDVYSRYPGGVPPYEHLSPRERELLEDVERENAALERLRRERAYAYRDQQLPPPLDSGRRGSVADGAGLLEHS